MAHEAGWTLKVSYAVVPTTPARVGNQRQLLMDRHVVEDWRECRRVVHQPVRHPDNPLITCGADEPHAVGHPSVIHDDEEGLFRLWVHGDILRGSRARMTHYSQTFGRYFESKDGVQWEAPNLDLFEVEGVPCRNIYLADPKRAASATVSELPPKWRHKGRYATVYDNGMMGRRDFPDLDANGQRQQIAFSDDGIHWEAAEENPIFAGQSDTDNNLCYNPERDVFMLYRRAPINAGEIRRIGYSESADLIHWTQPTQVITRDELDPYSLYGMTVVRYQGVYFGFLQMFYLRTPLGAGARASSDTLSDSLQPLAQQAKPDKHMQVDCQLAWSRDGIEWQRHPQRPVFFDNGPVGSYDWGMLYIGRGLVEREDRLDIYYAAHQRLHVPMSGASHICMASLRKDGFVSVEAPGKGTLLTRPIECPGGKLHVNGCTGTSGSIRVSLRRGDGDMDGLPLSGWDQADSAAVSGDVLDEVVGWGNRDDLGDLKGRAVRLEFSLEQAELFSFCDGTLTLKNLETSDEAIVADGQQSITYRGPPGHRRAEPPAVATAPGLGIEQVQVSVAGPKRDAIVRNHRPAESAAATIWTPARRHGQQFQPHAVAPLGSSGFRRQDLTVAVRRGA